MITNAEYYEYHESKSELGYGQMDVIPCRACGKDIRKSNSSPDETLCDHCFEIEED